MAVRQYIGARYVPRFTGLYNATQIYDALDVVDNGLGTSYIAKKTVPAGTALTNTDYWFVYGASSGAIINLQNQIDTINNTDLPAIDSRLDAHAQLINRNYILIGDSYCTVESNQVPRIMASKLYKSIGTGFYYSAVGGAGFVNGTTFLNQLQTLEAGGTFNNDDITDIIVIGGVNDGSYTYNDIYDAVVAFINYCATAFVHAKVHVGFVSKSTTTGAIYAMLPNVIRAYSNGACGGIKASYIKGAESILTNNMISNDYIHPTLAGCNVLGWKLAEYLLSGSIPDYMSHNTMTAHFDVTNITGSDVTITLDRNSNDQIYVHSPAFLFAFTGNAPANKFANGEKLCSLVGGGYLISPSYEVGVIPVTCSAKILNAVASGTEHLWLDCAGILKLTADGIYLKTLPSYDLAQTKNMSQMAIWQGINTYIDPFYC